MSETEIVSCSFCGGNFWATPESAQRHFRSGTHMRAIKAKREKEDWQKEREGKSHALDVELASALEGHILRPGDEVTTRTGREFKKDIHGKLFEVPAGSL